MSNATAELPSPDTLAGKAWRYPDIIKGIIIRAKQPGYTRAAWDALTEMIAVDDFVRVGRFKEVMDWRQTLDLMDQFARGAEFHCEVLRVNEVDNMAFLELQERATMNGETHEMVTMTVFEFNAAGKITRLDFFQ